jgi:hypothetical protein
MKSPQKVCPMSLKECIDGELMIVYPVKVSCRIWDAKAKECKLVLACDRIVGAPAKKVS